jgi:hypothetical protein
MLASEVGKHHQGQLCADREQQPVSFYLQEGVEV